MRDDSALPYDAAIIGAGPAGAATAVHLVRAGWHVVLADRATFPRDKPCAEYLSPAAEPLLAELGALAEVTREPVARLRGFRIFAPDGRMFQGDFAATRDAEGMSRYATGMAVPRVRLDAALVHAAVAAGAELRTGWRLAALAWDAPAGHWLLRPASGAAIRTRLLVGADGVHSTVARRLGLHVPGRLRKIALVAHMRGIAGLGEYGEVHVAGRRYVGLAPLEPPAQGDLCNVALVCDEVRDGRAVAGRVQASLLQTLETFPRLRGRLAGVVIARPALTASRMDVRALRLSGDGLLLVGDAAGYYDPFTGEGIYRGLRGAQLAAVTASAALRAGDLRAHALARYDGMVHAELRGRHVVEQLIQRGVQVPPLMNHFAHVLARHKGMADAIVAVTGDFLPASAIMRPGFLLRLLV